MPIKSFPISEIAWEFLRRNPGYQAEARLHGMRLGRANSGFDFPVYRQAEHDRKAECWGLLAYTAPNAQAKNTPPFWAIGPMIEAEIVETANAPFLPRLRQSGARVSGLALQDGGFVLRISREHHAVQLHVAGGDIASLSLDIALRIPFGLRLPVLLSRANDLWNMAFEEHPKKVQPLIQRNSPNFFSPLTA